MHFQKGFSSILIIGVIAGILVLGGAFYLNQYRQDKLQTNSITEQQIVTSKTFSSKNFPFTFEYPSEVSLNENQVADFYVLKVNLPTASISIAPNKFTDSPCVGGPEMANLSKKEFQTMIGNQQVKGSELVFSDGRSSTCKTLLLNDYYYVIQFNNQDSQSRVEVNQILSTFKFN